MASARFEANAIVRIEGTLYSLIRKVSDDLWQLEDQSTRRVVEHTDTQLRQLYVQRKLQFVPIKSHTADRPRNSPFELDNEAFAMAKLRRSYVLATEGLPATRSRLEPQIHAHWVKLGGQGNCPHAATVLRWRQRYRDSGNDIRALGENKSRKGNRTQRFSTEVERIAKQSIDEVFLTLERGTVQQTLEHAIALVAGENKLRPAQDQISRPTRRLIKRLIDRIDAFDRYVARHGRDAAIKHFRAVLKQDRLDTPLARAEIDHTRMDLFVVNADSGMPLGRPWLTVCIDSATRNILGIFIGFVPPSYLSVSKCLRDAFTPKAWLRTEYPDIVNDWHAHGVMYVVVVDNGLEFHSYALEQACGSLGTEIVYAPRRTGWFKGKVERFLGTVSSNLLHQCPGTTFSNIFDKEDYDPAKHAVITLPNLRYAVRKWVADYYHQKPHRGLDRTPPAVVWERSIRPEDIAVPEDLLALDAILGRPDQRVLTHRGIEYDGLFYNSVEMVDVRRRLGSRLDVEIRVDDGDIGYVVVLEPDNKRPFRVPALAHDYALGMTRWQHGVCKRYAANKREGLTNIEDWAEAKLEIIELIEADAHFGKRRTRTKAARFMDSGSERTTPLPD